MANSTLKKMMFYGATLLSTGAAAQNIQQNDNVYFVLNDTREYTLFSETLYQRAVPYAVELGLNAFSIERTNTGECVPVNFHGNTQSILQKTVKQFSLNDALMYGQTHYVRSVTAQEAKEKMITDYKSAQKLANQTCAPIL